MKGMAGPAAGAEGPLPKEYMDQYGQVCDKVTSWETTLLDGQVSVWQPSSPWHTLWQFNQGLGCCLYLLYLWKVDFKARK